MDLIYREGKFFKVNTSLLSEKANRMDVINALYAALYEEFRGASENPVYMNLSLLERLQAVNDYASNWLKDRGLS